MYVSIDKGGVIIAYFLSLMDCGLMRQREQQNRRILGT
jgi:hypothetical protein